MYVNLTDPSELDFHVRRLYDLCTELYYIDRQYWVEEFEYAVVDIPKTIDLRTIIVCFLLGIYTENSLPFFKEVVEEFKENFYFKEDFNESYKAFSEYYLGGHDANSLLEHNIHANWGW